jgi:hypothetical protein
MIGTLWNTWRYHDFKSGYSINEMEYMKVLEMRCQKQLTLHIPRNLKSGDFNVLIERERE